MVSAGRFPHRLSHARTRIGRASRVALTGVVLQVSACGGPGPAGSPGGEPLVVGVVDALEHRATASGITVRALEGSREMCGIAATASGDTRYFRRAPNAGLFPASVAALGVGDTVEVYVDGPVAESCPVQGHASAIVILEG